MADIHIRLFKRHKEYRECFQTLYQMLLTTDLSDTVIVVAGDIVHSKTDLSPEMVELASDFLSKCSDLAPTLVIAGNHDLNMANANRLDALSPIIANIKNDNLHYLKHSGIYQCADVDFYVWSLIGDQSEWPAPQINGRRRICLFHGPVHNAKTDVGYTVTNRHVMIETFDGFDIVMLGDIHRHQILQHREVLTGRPIIVYSSSLIQQNHGENRIGHGYCDWDLESMTFQFHELPNRYGFYTLEVENGKIPDWSDMPEVVHLRIFAGSLSQAETKELIAQIRASRVLNEVSVTNFEGAKRLSPTSNTHALLDIFDVNVQNKLIAEYLFEAMPSISTETVERVLALNKAKNEEISAEDLARKVIWKPLTLKYSNLFTYGESNDIDFTKLNGVLGIFAPNTSGKTSIAEAICFALYDKTPRTQKAVEIMNTRAKKCWCEFRFEIEGKEYIIERRGTKNAKGEVKMEVDFSVMNGTTKVSLNGEDRRYTNQVIRNCVGDFEDFLLTTFSSSSQQGLFVDRGQSDRKDLLSQFMGLTIFDKLHTKANDESKEVAGALKRFKHDDFTQELADVRKEINDTEYHTVEANTKLDTVNDRLNELTASIQVLYQEKVPVKYGADITVLESRKAKAVEGLLFEREQMSKTEKHLVDQQTMLATAEKRIAEMDADDIKTLHERRHETISRRDRTNTEVQAKQREMKLLRDRVMELEKHEYDPECQFCVKNGNHTIKAKEDAMYRIAVLEMDIRNLLDVMEGFNVVLADTYPASIDDRYQKWVTGKAWIQKATTEVAQTETAIERHRTKIQQLETSLHTVEYEIKEFYAQIDVISHNRRVQEKIDALEVDKTARKKEFNEFTTQVQRGLARVAMLQEREREMLDKIREAEDLEARYEAYEAYLTAVCRDGLPYKLIAEILPNLEAAVNDLLTQMVGFTLIFETDGKNINMKIRYDDDRIWPLNLASGMEKFITSLAIRVALTGLSSLPKTNFLIVDEGLGTLDQDNLASMFMLFNVLRTRFDFIMLISHVDEVRDMADMLVEIKRSPDGFSQIQVP